MAIVHESASSARSLTCNVPAGTADGDLLVALVSVENLIGSSTLTNPAGWTQVYRTQNVSSSRDHEFVLSYIKISGTPPASYSWSYGDSYDDSYTFIHRFSGVDDFQGYTINGSTNSTTATALSITPDTDGSLVVWFCGGNMPTSTASTPSGFSNASKQKEALPDSLLCSLIQGTASATGNKISSGWFAGTSFTQYAGMAVFRPAIADSTPPTLTSPSGTATGGTAADLSVTTNEANGTLYAVVTESSTSPSAAQVKAGQDHTGSAAVFDDSQAISSTGSKSFSATGLTASTTYYAHYMHEDAATNQSSVVTSSSFTTDADSVSPDLYRKTLRRRSRCIF